jgi:hypothetical protein
MRVSYLKLEVCLHRLHIGANRSLVLAQLHVDMGCLLCWGRVCVCVHRGVRVSSRRIE